MKAPASEGNHSLYRTWGNITQSAFPWFRALSSEVSIWLPEQCFCRSFQKLEDSLDEQDHLSQTEGSCLLSYTHTDALKATLEHCGVNHTFQANISSHGLWYSSYCGIFCYVKNSLRGIYAPILFMEIISYSQNTDICPSHREGSLIAFSQRESGCWSAPFQL